MHNSLRSVDASQPHFLSIHAHAHLLTKPSSPYHSTYDQNAIVTLHPLTHDTLLKNHDQSYQTNHHTHLNPNPAVRPLRHSERHQHSSANEPCRIHPILHRHLQLWHGCQSQKDRFLGQKRKDFVYVVGWGDTGPHQHHPRQDL